MLGVLRFFQGRVATHELAVILLMPALPTSATGKTYHGARKRGHVA